MSRPNSAIKTKNFINPKNPKLQGSLIIIQKERLGSAKSKKSVMIIDKGNYKVQYDIDQNIDKEKIDKTVKDIEKKVLTMSNKFNNANKITNIENTEVLKLKANNDSFNNEKGNNFNNKNIDDKNQESDKALINSDSSNNDDKEKITEIVNNIIKEDNKIINKEKEKENEKEDEENNEYNYYDNDNYSYENKNERKFMIFHANSFNDNFIDETFLSCYICDRTYPLYKLYSADCEKHFICRRCCKNYYEERIEQGEKDLKCSVFTCNNSFNPGLKILRTILSPNHINLLLDSKIKNNENQLIEPSLSLQKKYNITHQSSDVMKLYMKKHVIDINSNQNFFMYNKAKVQFCPKCGEQSLFSKTGTYFVKCLNCFHRICKYCMKEYNELHMDISNDNHCKIYYRKDAVDEENEKNSLFYNFLIEIFLILGAFIFLFIGAFYYFKNCLKAIFCIKRNEDYGCLKALIINFVTFILFFMSFPILLISLPYFPIFNSIFGF